MKRYCLRCGGLGKVYGFETYSEPLTPMFPVLISVYTATVKVCPACDGRGVLEVRPRLAVIKGGKR